MRPAVRIASFGLILLAAQPSDAQFPQHTVAGSLAEIAPTRRARLEGGSHDARWRLGRLRLDPRLQIGQLGYVDNVFSAPEGEPKVADYHAVVSAGLVSYLQLGPKVVASAFAIPEYTWWQDREELRQLNLSAGLGLFAYFNRMTVELQGQRLEGERPLSSELEAPIEVRTDRAGLNVEVDLWGPVSLFADVSQARIEHRQTRIPAAGLDLGLLDRDETVTDLGLRYSLSNGFSIGLGAQLSDAEFRRDPGGRSNSGTSPMVHVAYDSDRLGLGVTAVRRDLRFSAGGDFTEGTGQAQATWKLQARRSLSLYGARTLVYSAFEGEAFFTEDRAGLAASSPLGHRVTLQVFGEQGRNRLDSTTRIAAARRDDFAALGGSLVIAAGRQVKIRLAAQRTEFDSNLAGFDRSVTSFRSSLELGQELFPW